MTFWKKISNWSSVWCCESGQGSNFSLRPLFHSLHNYFYHISCETLIGDAVNAFRERTLHCTDHVIHGVETAGWKRKCEALWRRRLSLSASVGFKNTFFTFRHGQNEIWNKCCLKHTEASLQSSHHRSVLQRELDHMEIKSSQSFTCNFHIYLQVCY